VQRHRCQFAYLAPSVHLGDMQNRRQIHVGTSASPRQSSSAVNEVVYALQRKLTANHLDYPPSSYPSPRRPSFSMDSILHPKKEKRHEEAKDREARSQKRKSLTMRGGKSVDRVSGPSPRVAAVRPGRFEMVIESPPLVFYGTAQVSTGALLSGRLKLVVEDPTGELRLDTFTMVLRASITTKKPIGKDCGECRERHDELKQWNFLSEPKTFYQEEDNHFPYSYLLPGHLPATTQSQLGAITYALVVSATTSHGEKIDLIHPLTIQRAIQPGHERSSIRIFPPTNLTARVQLPPVVHPIGTFPAILTLSGVVEKKANAQTRWRLRKLSWRIEEHSKGVSTPCAKHAHKIGEGKSIQHSETRTLGSDDIKTGWKTDFDTPGGEILMEFEASLASNSKFKATCDVESATGVEVKHNLVVELIVAEEFCPNKSPQLITPTGAARVLRMQFALIVTERAGMGISWDEEMPPVYEDVPASPPGYGSADKNDGAWGGAVMEDYEGSELEYEELERIQSDNPNDPPTYRERNPADINSGLPMRERIRRRTSGSEPEHAGPSRRVVGGWTEDELGAEPPQYGLRGRRASTNSQQAPEEDYGEGTSGHPI